MKANSATMKAVKLTASSNRKENLKKDFLETTRFRFDEEEDILEEENLVSQRKFSALDIIGAAKKPAKKTSEEEDDIDEEDLEEDDFEFEEENFDEDLDDLDFLDDDDDDDFDDDFF